LTEILWLSLVTVGQQSQPSSERIPFYPELGLPEGQALPVPRATFSAAQAPRPQNHNE
jgi:hypothetical protein